MPPVYHGERMRGGNLEVNLFFRGLDSASGAGQSERPDILVKNVSAGRKHM